MLKILLIINFALLVSGKPGNSWDADGDGIHNKYDWDDDNDGIHDKFDWNDDNHRSGGNYGGGGNSMGDIAVILACVFVPLLVSFVLFWCVIKEFYGICR